MAKNETEKTIKITVELSDNSVDLKELNQDLGKLAGNLEKLKNLGLKIRIDK